MAETETNKHKPVTPIDASKPFYIVIWQTETRNSMEVIQGDDALTKATERGAELARTTKRKILLVGPQRMAFAPPAEVQTDTFDF